MILRMSNICKDYNLGNIVSRVIKNVNLEVDKGEYLSIMGPSGSGKTTLMNIIGCLDRPTEGEYFLDDVDVFKSTDNQLADIRNQKIGFIFQSFNLLPKLSAVENVALPLLYRGVKKEVRLQLAKEELEKVGLGDKLNHMPNQMSGGQCQRVAIARAMVGKPSLLLADEPTGALDQESGRQIMELFDTIHSEGATIIMITHDKKVADRASRHLSILDGILTGGDSNE